MGMNDLPVVPDPFWPEGAVPTHLSPADARDKSIVDKFVDLTGAWKCEKCGTTLNRSPKDSRFCNECYIQQTKNTAVAKRINADWMEQSAECGLQIFERQPEESDLEWLIWQRYRMHYPMRLPTWSELAKECTTSVASVTNASQKWSFRVRIQAWARYTDSVDEQERIEHIKEMNTRQISMSKTLQIKLKDAIDRLDPTQLRPNEIVNLLKASTELERKIALAAPEKVSNEAVTDNKSNARITKVEDLGDVVDILRSTGVLEGKTIGLEHATRVVIKEDNNA